MLHLITEHFAVLNTSNQINQQQTLVSGLPDNVHWHGLVDLSQSSVVKDCNLLRLTPKQPQQSPKMSLQRTSANGKAKNVVGRGEA